MKKEGKKQRVTALILSGGKGARMKNATVPKQFIKVCGKELFLYAVDTYERMREIDDICLVVNAEYQKDYIRILKKKTYRKISCLVGGGVLRQYSVKNGIDAIKHNGWVVLQNGVNPNTSVDLIKKCIRAAKETGASTAFVPASHTVFIRKGERLGHILPRGILGYVNDPQVYALRSIRKALMKMDLYAQRDIPTLELMEKIKQPVALIESDRNNVKVTIERDLKTVEFLLKTKPRI